MVASTARLLLRALLALIVLALVGLAALWWFQRDLIYPGVGKYAAVWTLDPEGFEPVELRTEDGLTLRAMYRAARPGEDTILFFHGNGGSIRASINAVDTFVEQGRGALLVEYRGFAGNPGEPSEEGLYRDGRAGVAFLAARGIGPDRLIVGGYSLGSGVASKIAEEVRPKGLYLLAPFTSLADAAADTMGLPMLDLLVSDRFDTRSRLADIHVPLLIVHGEADEIVPVAHGRALAKLRPDAEAHFQPGIGHHVAWSDETAKRIEEWMDGLPETRSER